MIILCVFSLHILSSNANTEQSVCDVKVLKLLNFLFCLYCLLQRESDELGYQLPDLAVRLYSVVKGY
jgi:hypothetical protein